MEPARHGNGPVAAAVRVLPADDVVLDGEAVVFRPDGHSDFAALGRSRAAEARSWLQRSARRGEDRPKSLLRRRPRLRGSSSPAATAFPLSQAIEAEGALVYAKACEMGLEGRNWLKVKKNRRS